MKFPLALLLLVFSCIACAHLRKRDIGPNLISEMEKDCRKVMIKMDYDEGVYVITNTGKISKDKCPIALIQGWKDDRIIEQKEVDICGCRDR